VEAFQQGRDGDTEQRVNAMRVDLDERHEHESAVGELGVRQRDPVILEHGVAVEEEIEVDRARPMAPVGVAHAAHAAFDEQQVPQEGLRLEFGLEHRHRVQEVGLLEVPDRRRVVERRALHQLGGGKLRNLLDRGPDLPLAIAQVRAERHVRHGHDVTGFRRTPMPSISTSTTSPDVSAPCFGA